ncbi:deoxyribodipyrimidine photo-lyase [Aureobasidium subglaciale]|nr:deoxyribodipyrimidine photo-lyase [Aureobasidium subglaciale]
MPPKRKATSSPTSDAPAIKKSALEALQPSVKPEVKTEPETKIKSENAPDYNDPKREVLEEEYGVIQREFYPAEMSNERCAQYNANEIPRPIEVLTQAVQKTAFARKKIEVGDAVVHWFKRDLRTKDNRALHLASKKAKSKGVPLICLFIISPQDYQAHLTAPVRVDFELRTLQVLKEDLARKDIPLYVETVEIRKKAPGRIIELCQSWGAKHIFCNIEYEVDELRRETLLTNLCLEKGMDFHAVHDDVVVPPGNLTTGQGKQYSVYTPWYKAWIRHIHENPTLLDEFAAPEQNPASARQKHVALFETTIPTAPENKKLNDEEKERFKALWPPGEHEALDRLSSFLNKKITKYKDARNIPAANSTGVISVHLSSGTLAARTAIRSARNINSSNNLDSGNEGIKTWISEVAWRDFYKHVLAHWPYVCMSKPFKYEYTKVRWEYNDEHFARWCEGRTGFPLVDAAIRQMHSMAYMHNRCHWRMGERYFMEHLIDGDFASNNGGWGFSASTGVDPQPYFRVFNPLLQSEKFDEQGEYIRKWLPELKNIKGKAIHDPYGRGAGKEAEKAGYPRPMVDHKVCRDRCLARYKEALGKSTA